SIQLSYGRAVPMTAGARHTGPGQTAQPRRSAVGTVARCGSLPPAMRQEETLNSALRRNIEVLRRRRAEEDARANAEERIARAITRFSGSMRFVYLHLLLYGGWIALNLGWIGPLRPWDPSFVVLAMVASVEAIFLSTFILITQNRMAAAADRRAELDVQISLLAEAEITKLVEMVSEIADRMDVPLANEEDVQEMKERVQPEVVLDAIEEAQTEA